MCGLAWIARRRLSPTLTYLFAKSFHAHFSHSGAWTRYGASLSNLELVLEQAVDAGGVGADQVVHRGIVVGLLAGVVAIEPEEAGVEASDRLPAVAQELLEESPFVRAKVAALDEFDGQAGKARDLPRDVLALVGGKPRVLEAAPRCTLRSRKSPRAITCRSDFRCRSGASAL
jgi:hypothetical protein